VQMPSSAPCSRTPSIYILPLGWCVEIYTHAEQ
jgi:hypothetical protein